MRGNEENKYTLEEPGKYFFYDGELIKAKAHPEITERVVISTDLGGTLCGNKEALKKFKKLWLEHFYFHAQRKHVLVYNSGRRLPSYLALAEREKLLKPDYFLSGCGCYVYRNVQGKLVEDGDWKALISENWNV